MPRGPSLNAKRAGQLVVEKVRKGEKVVLREILPKAGYSQAIADRPGQVVKQRAFIEELERAGLTDERVAGVMSDLLGSETIQKFYLDAYEDAKGKKGQVKKISDKQIKKIVESVKGCRVLYINRFRHWRNIEVVYAVPDRLIQKAAAELVIKAKGQMEPDKLLVAGHIHHTYEEIPVEQAQEIDEILEENK